MLDVHVIDSERPGPVFLVLGAIHGNEKCGSHAIARAVMEIRSGIFRIKAGKLVCVPICNPAAYQRNQRYVETNLNRVIKRHKSPFRYEDKLANAVVALIDQCDVMLDLHSYSSGKRPFLFLDNDTKEQADFARALNIPYWVTGWNDLYQDQPVLWSGDTTTYALSKPGRMGLLVECGLHEDPQSAVVAYNSLRAALAYYKLTDPYDMPRAEPPTVTRMKAMVVKKKEGLFLKDWQHLDPVTKGMPILRYDDGEIYFSPIDGVIMLPAKRTPVGEEWVYFGEEVA